MKRTVSAFLAGIVFAAGLGLSGMTNPEKVVGFLDVAGPWDPTHAFVMAGAIALHVGAAQWALRAQRPLWASAFRLPRSTTLDARLVVGAALFGVGWGIAGFCPGPALVDLVAPSPSVVTFVAAMLVGVVLVRARGPRLPERLAARPSGSERTRALHPNRSPSRPSAT
jgi:uncharacterized membrane protein YedE/YeeE